MGVFPLSFSLHTLDRLLPLFSSAFLEHSIPQSDNDQFRLVIFAGNIDKNVIIVGGLRSETKSIG